MRRIRALFVFLVVSLMFGSVGGTARPAQAFAPTLIYLPLVMGGGQQVGAPTPTSTPTVTPSPSPSPTATTAPNLSIPKGIGLYTPNAEDLEELESEWYFAWGMTSPIVSQVEFVPMTKSGLETFPPCPKYLLVFNEPERTDGGEVHVVPADAVTRVQAIEAACPYVPNPNDPEDWSGTRTIVGNVVTFNEPDLGYQAGGWLQEFIHLYPGYDGALGGHCYAWRVADACLSVFAQYATLGRPLWVTETNVFLPDPGEMTRLLNGAALYAERVAVYTNRISDDDSWKDRETELVDSNGVLFPQGQEFADWGD